MFTKHKFSLALSVAVLLSLAITSLALAGGAYTGQPANRGGIVHPLLQRNGTGFSTGGGWFLWPGTQDKTNFAFNVKVNSKLPGVTGNLLMVRHAAAGHITSLKSSSLSNLIIQEVNGCSVATFSGMGTYRAWDASLKKYISRAGVAFSVYARDCGEPGKGVDSLWISSTADLVMTGPAASHLAPIGGGNNAIQHAAPQNNAGSGMIPAPWQPGPFDKIVPPPRD